MFQVLSYITQLLGTPHITPLLNWQNPPWVRQEQYGADRSVSFWSSSCLKDPAIRQDEHLRPISQVSSVCYHMAGRPATQVWSETDDLIGQVDCFAWLLKLKLAVSGPPP